MSKRKSRTKKGPRPLPAWKRRDQALKVYLSPQERQRLEAAAIGENRSVSDWARGVLMEAAQ